MKSKLSLWQIVGLIASTAPVLYLTVPALHNLFFGSSMFTFSFGITFLILPLITSMLLWGLVLWRKKIWIRIILAVVVLALAYFSLIFSTLVGDFRNQTIHSGQDALTHYAGLAYPEGMPDPESLGSPVDTVFVSYRLSCAIFISDCDSLILTYPPEEYAARTAELNRQDIFHTEPLSSSEDPLPPEFTWEGWHFRYLKMGSKFSSENLTYPSRMILIGTNDAESAICYLYFNDFDLDYISSHEEFLLNYCGWKFIR